MNVQEENRCKGSHSGIPSLLAGDLRDSLCSRRRYRYSCTLQATSYDVERAESREQSLENCRVVEIQIQNECSFFAFTHQERATDRIDVRLAQCSDEGTATLSRSLCVFTHVSDMIATDVITRPHCKDP
jgi:hypothetical protein